MMSRKHFKKIAEILSEGYGMTSENLDKITNAFIEYFKTENPLFDSQRFRNAVFEEKE